MHLGVRAQEVGQAGEAAGESGGTIAAGSGAASKSAGVARFTPASVACADSATATSTTMGTNHPDTVSARR